MTKLILLAAEVLFAAEVLQIIMWAYHDDVNIARDSAEESLHLFLHATKVEFARY